MITCAVMLGGARPVPAAPAPPETLDPDASCSSSECHSRIRDLPRLHEPLSEGDCSMCHEQEGESHAFAAISDTMELCSMCHDGIADGANVHAPASDDCLMCHDPHGGAGKGILTEERPDLCFQCHDTELMEGKRRHGPAAAGECNACHDPHASAHEKMLRTQAKELCRECHEDIFDAAAASKVKHGPVLSDDGCPKCHAPHSSDAASLLRTEQPGLCLDCHRNHLRAADGSTLASMAALLSGDNRWHAPVEDGCTDCHLPHGGQHSRLLQDRYPSTLYASFATEAFGLCFACHDEALVTEARTTDDTEFRDGDRNLHFLHVNKKERGRTCRLCHEIHAGTQPALVREMVPYGKWELPMSFDRTETGGSCLPGCHAKKDYDRERKKK